MKKKYKSAQRLLGYHVYFNTIRDSNGQIVAKIKRHQIVSHDDLFFKSVLSSNTIIDVTAKELKNRKIKYTLYNEQTKEIFAKADRFLTSIPLKINYLGSFFNSTKSILFIIRCTIFAILALFISFVSLQTTGNPTRPKEIVISERDGDIILDEWNIFGSQIGDKILYPGKWVNIILVLPILIPKILYYQLNLLKIIKIHFLLYTGWFVRMNIFVVKQTIGLILMNCMLMKF